MFRQWSENSFRLKPSLRVIRKCRCIAISYRGMRSFRRHVPRSRVYEFWARTARQNRLQVTHRRHDLLGKPPHAGQDFLMGH